MSNRQDLVAARAVALSTAWLQVERAIHGDRFATKAELTAHLDDPMSWWTWQEAEQVMAVATEDVRKTVDRFDAMLVRAFLHAFDDIFHRDREGEDLDAGFGFIPPHQPMPYLADKRVVRLQNRLNLSFARIERVLEAWASVEAQKGPAHRTPRCHDYLTMLLDGC